MAYPRLSVHIVTWNSMAFLPELLASLEAQTYKDFQVLLIDNASTDGVEAFVRDAHPTMTLLRNARNLGFSSAHNQGIRYAFERWGEEDLSKRYVLVTNPDIVFSPTYIEEILREADQHEESASFGGKLLCAFKQMPTDDAPLETVFSDRIDTTGLLAHRNRTFSERGSGEMDEGQYDQALEVFGAPGALALYRASALKEVRYRDEFFDADFFLYKEDVDLAWRLRSAGFESRYVPGAVAHHHRAMADREGKGIIARMRNRRKKSRTRSFYSTRNHLCLLVKNETVLNGLLAAPWILSMEISRFVYVALFEPRLLPAFSEAVFRIPKMLIKRQAIKRAVPSSAIRRFFI